MVGVVVVGVERPLLMQTRGRCTSSAALSLIVQVVIAVMEVVVENDSGGYGDGIK